MKFIQNIFGAIMKKIMTLLLGLLVISSVSVFAQDTTKTTMQDPTKDSINFDDYNLLGGSKLKKWMSFSGCTKSYILNEAPTINIQYGNSAGDYQHKRFNSDIVENGIIAANLGYTSISRLNKSYLLEYDFSSLSISNMNRELFAKDEIASEEFKTRLWRLGLSSADGYGWALNDDVYFVLYHSSGINWNTLDVKSKSLDSASNHAINVFGKQTRYGKHFAGGAKVFLTKHIALNAEYEKSMIYPRHMFWKDMLSSIIEASAQGIAGAFIGKIEKEAPAIVPIVHFILKNGISYGFYELYKEKMNWPVKTAAPYINENLKVGIDFIF